MGKLIDLTGKRFSRLVVLRKVGSKQGHTFWECVCDDGNIVIVRSSSLVGGETKSCGCLRRETLLHRRHGLSKTAAYKSYIDAKRRCTNSDRSDFAAYGGRGIRFLLTIEQIIATIGDRPPGKTLERIDKNGDYVVGNIKWATRAEQARNRRPPKRKLGNVRLYSSRMIKREARRAKLAEIRKYAALARAAEGNEE
jgi:hypothetical protein